MRLLQSKSTPTLLWVVFLAIGLLASGFCCKPVAENHATPCLKARLACPPASADEASIQNGESAPFYPNGFVLLLLISLVGLARGDASPFCRAGGNAPRTLPSLRSAPQFLRPPPHFKPAH